MNLSHLSQSSGRDVEIAAEFLKEGSPLVVRFESLDQSDAETTMIASLMVDAHKAKAGRRITIRQAAGVRGRDSIKEIVSGSDKAAKSVPGDIVCFSSSFVKNGVVYVGKASARTHDGIVGSHQVVTAMARCSQSRVTKAGPSHFLTITDGNAARIASSVEDVVSLLEAATARKWPGGNAGLIMRSREGATVEWFTGFDRDIDYLASELRAQETLVGQKLEIIPAWRIMMGREQIYREIDPSKETGAQSGPVTRQFEHKNINGKQGFLPCLIVLSDEDEWAFKAKTGKNRRVVSGVQPILGRTPILANRLPSAVRAYGGNPNGILEALSEGEIEKAATRRAGLRPTEFVQERETQASTASRRIDLRTRSVGLGRR